MADKGAIDEQLKKLSDKIDGLRNDMMKALDETDERKREKKKHFFDGAIFFYGLVVGLIAGTLGNIFASVSYDLAKTEPNFNLISAFWISVSCLVGVLITLSIVSYYLWRQVKKS